MAPPADKKKAGSGKAPAPAPGAAKKENKPPAKGGSSKAPAPAPAAAAKPAAEKKPEAKKAVKTPAPAPKVTEKKAAPAKEEAKVAKEPAAAAGGDAPPEAKKAKAEAKAAKKAEKKAAKKATPKKKTTATPLRGKGTVSKKKKVATKFIIDCTLPAEDSLFNCADFEKFLRERIKINGKTNNFGSALSIERGDKNKVIVNASCPFSKRYLKYLTKKYLKKNLLRDTLRVISNNKDSYELRYFQIGGEADEEEDANE